MSANTLFIRLEGPMQAWGNQESKFVIRRTAEAPTKSGVIGLLCAALGVNRAEAADEWLPKLSNLRMGVRIDSPGIRWWDYHTVGAGMQMRIAEGPGKTKEGPILTRREYLCDASFLVAMLGDGELIRELDSALRNPRWTLYLGKKSCPPSRPMMELPPGEYADPLTALSSVSLRKRFERDIIPDILECSFDWMPTPEELEAPDDALVRYDVPVSFDPPAHRPRFVVKAHIRTADLPSGERPLQSKTPPPLRPRADYGNTLYRNMRKERLARDNHLCVFCKSPATTTQHITYRHAGGGERLDELRSLCRLCHDAVTMIEYGMGMGLDRINPEEAGWRDAILKKRSEIIEFRSLETRRRKLAAEEVE